MSSNSQKPFNKEYVINTTLKNMRKSIDVSVQKTLGRISEFADDPAKSQEVFYTLTELQGLRTALNAFKSQSTESACNVSI